MSHRVGLMVLMGKKVSSVWLARLFFCSFYFVGHSTLKSHARSPGEELRNCVVFTFLSHWKTSSTLLSLTGFPDSGTRARKQVEEEFWDGKPSLLIMPLPA